MPEAEEEIALSRRASEADVAAAKAASARARLESWGGEPGLPPQQSDAAWRADVAKKTVDSVKAVKVALGKAAAVTRAHCDYTPTSGRARIEDRTPRSNPPGAA